MRLLAFIILILSLSTAAGSQTPAATPIRLGDVAQNLSAADLADLESTIPGGRKPWLLINDQGVIPNPGVVQVYLPLVAATATVRRGPLLLLLNERRTPGWVITDTRVAFGLRGSDTQNLQPAQSATWAQVAISGRSSEDIQGLDDLNRPFAVYGLLDDTTLVSLVEFFRSNWPSIPARPSPLQPITSIARLMDDTVRVTMRSRPGAFRWFTLQRQGQDWVVVERGGGIV